MAGMLFLPLLSLLSRCLPLQKDTTVESPPKISHGRQHPRFAQSQDASSESPHHGSPPPLHPPSPKPTGGPPLPAREQQHPCLVAATAAAAAAATTPPLWLDSYHCHLRLPGCPAHPAANNTSASRHRRSDTWHHPTAHDNYPDSYFPFTSPACNRCGTGSLDKSV